MSKINLPIAIIIAGIIIAGALIFTGGRGNDSVSTSGQIQGNTGVQQPSGDFRLIGPDDHVRGNPDAPVTVVEFSDFECPFCARLHPTLTRISDEFPEDMNWVYRHFPLTSIHSRALSAAISSECVAKLGGNDAFWKFTDAMFEDQSRLGTEFYDEVASGLGIDAEDFNECTQSPEAEQKVAEDFEEAIGSGGQGTPFSVIIAADGSLRPFSGALPYEQVRDLVQQAIDS